MRQRASSSFAGMRRCLILLLEGEAGMRRRLVNPLDDEASTHLPSLRRGVASFFCWKARRGRGGASSFSVVTMRCLVITLEDKASPRRPLLGRGAASFFCRKARCRASSSSVGTRCCLILPGLG
ncbi:hypothetical protein BHE74_00050203 [Ensete ventricosum]|nr:hypothetical protein BHE74_00050203 [Ensete ventricosum]